MTSKTGQPKKRRITGNRQKIVDSARELFVEKGYSGTSMSDIAKSAGVNKSLIYHHFESKDQLWNEILFSVTDEFLQMQRDNFNNPQNYTADYLRDLLKATFNYMKEHPESVRMSQWANLEDQRFGANKFEAAERWVYLQVMLENIRRAQEAGSLRNDVPPLHIFQYFMGSLSIWFQTKSRLEQMELMPVEELNDDQYLNNVIKMFFQGALPR